MKLRVKRKASDPIGEHHPPWSHRPFEVGCNVQWRRSTDKRWSKPTEILSIVKENGKVCFNVYSSPPGWITRPFTKNLIRHTPKRRVKR